MSSLRHALVVEDLDIWQDALSEVLIEAGYRVWVAPNHAQAMEALAQNEFHLAVIDPVLDDANRLNRDGLRILRHILKQQPGICAVVVSSSDPNRIRREVAEMSPDIPLLRKDQWGDEHFLSVIRDVTKVKREK